MYIIYTCTYILRVYVKKSDLFMQNNFNEMSTFNHLLFHCDVKKHNQIWYLRLLDIKLSCLLICRRVECKGKCLI